MTDVLSLSGVCVQSVTAERAACSDRCCDFSYARGLVGTSKTADDVKHTQSAKLCRGRVDAPIRRDSSRLFPKDKAGQRSSSSLAAQSAGYWGAARCP